MILIVEPLLLLRIIFIQILTKKRRSNKIRSTITFLWLTSTDLDGRAIMTVLLSAVSAATALFVSMVWSLVIPYLHCQVYPRQWRLGSQQRSERSGLPWFHWPVIRIVTRRRSQSSRLVCEGRSTWVLPRSLPWPLFLSPAFGSNLIQIRSLLFVGAD